MSDAERLREADANLARSQSRKLATRRPSEGVTFGTIDGLYPADPANLDGTSPHQWFWADNGRVLAFNLGRSFPGRPDYFTSAGGVTSWIGPDTYKAVLDGPSVQFTRQSNGWVFTYNGV